MIVKVSDVAIDPKLTVIVTLHVEHVTVTVRYVQGTINVTAHRILSRLNFYL